MSLSRDKKNKSKRLSLILPQQTYIEVKQIAEKQMLTVADIIRLSVIQYIQSAKIHNK